MINGIGHPEEWCLAVQQAALTTPREWFRTRYFQEFFPFLVKKC